MGWDRDTLVPLFKHIHSFIFSHALICHFSPLISRTLYRHYRNTAAEGRWEG